MRSPRRERHEFLGNFSDCNLRSVWNSQSTQSAPKEDTLILEMLPGQQPNVFKFKRIGQKFHTQHPAVQWQ